MGEFYRSICEITLKYRDSKETVIRKAVITLIPSMATFDSDEFETHYLHRSMAYLLQSLGKPTDRDIGMSILLLPIHPTYTPSVCCPRTPLGPARFQDAALSR